MPEFIVEGHGEKTKRHRKKSYWGKDENEVRQKAINDGTIVESIIELPEPIEYATESQKKFARDLGLMFPHDITKSEMSDLIDFKKSNDKEATDRHKSFADYFGVKYSNYIGKKQLFNLIFYDLLAPGREVDLAAWFTYRICRHICNGADDHPLATGPDANVIREIASELAYDERIIKSIKNYKDGKKLIWFGTYTAPDGRTYEGASKQTIAYKKAYELLNTYIKFSDNRKSFFNKIAIKNFGNNSFARYNTFIFLAILIIFISYCGIKNMKPNPKIPIEPQKDQIVSKSNPDELIDKFGALNAIQSYVKKTLAFPNAAIFPALSNESFNHTDYLDNKTYSITSYFDLPNKNGELIRTKFVGTVVQIGPDE
ncbi:MAG: hypothetical protein HZB23_01160 [Deltaproteobacteria bacterium]|nr:hypothetical protein [Deltaproteobacteria bacterium]